MKKFILLFSLPIINCQFLIGQEWFPIGATWHYEYLLDDGQQYREYAKKYVVEKDTTVLGKSCVKIVNLYNSQNTASYRYFDSGIVYYLEFYDTVWNVMYDFNKEVGDTLFYPQFQHLRPWSVDSLPYYVVIQFKFEKVINGDTLASYSASPQQMLMYGLGDFGLTATEVISGGEVMWYGLADPSGGPRGLRCYEDSILGFYRTLNFNLACDTTITNLENNLEEDIIRVFPNPALDKIYISLHQNRTSNSSNTQNVKLQIMDLQGKNIEVFHLAEPNSTLYISNLKPGIYFWEVSSEQYRVRDKLIIR